MYSVPAAHENFSPPVKKSIIRKERTDSMSRIRKLTGCTKRGKEVAKPVRANDNRQLRSFPIQY